jgi:predicted ABC-type sugar transport system permease subunit
MVNAVARRIYGGDSWVGGSPCMVNAVARRIYAGDPWLGGGAYMVNAVARRIYGGDPWVGELWCVAVVSLGYVRSGQT